MVNNITLQVPEMDRKKSLSMTYLPAQDRNFLCIPEAVSLQSLQEIQTLNDLSIRSYESLRRIESNTSITVPENFSFSEVAIRVYKIRWLILFLCLASITITYIQWIQYSIVANVVAKYYRVSSILVDWTSMVFMLAYSMLVFPVSFFMDIKAPRIAALTGCLVLALGSWIKVFSLKRDLFIITFVGQTFVAIAQVFVVSLPARLAATWFAPEEASKVCGLGVFSTQLGTALGFLMAPLIVQESNNMEVIHEHLEIMYLADAAMSTGVTIFTMTVFQAKPEKPPSHIQALQRSVRATNKGYWKSILNLANNNDFILLVIVYGMNVGVFNSMLTLLNQIILNYFPGREIDAGIIGAAMIATSLVGSLVFGFVMDTWHEYSKTAVWVYGISAVTVVLFCLSLESRSMKLLYVAAVLMGFFMSGLQTIGYELAAEVTFPEPDGPVAGLMTISTHFFGVLFTIGISRIHDTYGDLTGNMMFTLILVIGAVLTTQIKGDAKRHSAHKVVARAAEELAELEQKFIERKLPYLIPG
ncbi:feline leukemia virus subgroup C receptor-related protein 2 [Sergentomyia squamirostris]